MKNLELSKYSDKATFIDKFRNEVFAKKDRASWLPDIAISRDPGSGGKIIASMVAKKLGWKLYDKEILVSLAKQLGIPEDEFANIDERPRGYLVDIIQSLFNPNYISDVCYLAHLSKLILHASKDRQIVIVGRGASYILPPEKCLRVRITAPMHVRVRNTMKHEGMTKMVAYDHVKKVQSKRDLFVRQYFGRTARWISNYDIVVNTEFMSLEAARDIVIDAYYDKFSETVKK